jgi:hypothetical protein
MPSVITLKSTDGLAVGNVPARNIFLARISVCITVGVSVGGWFFLFATELATEMGFTDDWFTDGSFPSVTPSVLFSPTDFIAVTDGINPTTLMWFVLRAEICLKGKGLKCSPTLYRCSPKIDQEQQQIERRKR